MRWFKSGDLLDTAFAVGIILKGLDGILEVGGGVLLLVVSPATIDRVTKPLLSTSSLRTHTTTWRLICCMLPAA
jgi:uncharacterized membrane protein